MALTLSTNAKNNMLDGFTFTELTGFNATNQIVTSSEICTFGAASGGVRDITADVSLTVNIGATVAYVRASAGVDPATATNYADIDLTAGESFPDGGNLVVTSFAITQGAV